MLDEKQQYRIIRRVAKHTRSLIFKNKNTLYPGVANHLAGLCGNASALMFEALAKEGLSPQIVQGWGHWYTKCGPWLVDLTASQFGQGKICIRKFDKVQELVSSQERAMPWWQAVKVASTLKELGLEDTLKITKEKLVIK